MEIGLAVVGAVDACLTYGKLAVTKYSEFKEADEEIQERVLLIESAWAKISQQLSFLKRVWDTLDEEYQDMQERILQAFQKKLYAAVLEASRIEKYSASDGRTRLGKRKAAKYALWVKESLDKAIQDLRMWSTEFDQSWFLILRMAHHNIDDELVKEPDNEDLAVARRIRHVLQPQPHPSLTHDVFWKAATLSSAKRHNIPFATSEVIEVSKSGNSATYILESADCTAVNDLSAFAKHVQHLAIRLKQVDSQTFHLLQCEGVVRTRVPDTRRIRSFDFIFRMPKGYSEPRSLRSHLFSPQAPSLTAKIALAKQLAASVSYIHVLDFVHKNIRPETALIFEGTVSHFGPLFLLGFKAFRTADGKSLRLPKTDAIEGIYQHPERQGVQPDEDHKMQHDIYSLGVCLLEIGLWESFVTSDQPSRLCQSVFADCSNVAANMGSLKARFTELASRYLPARMGDVYTRVVINCLTCLDEENEDFGNENEFEDEYGVKVGVRYIEKILVHLNEISV